MALTLGGQGSAPRRRRLLDLPGEIHSLIADQLEAPGDRIRLAATCCTLREASVDWFLKDTFQMKSYEPTAEYLEWLCRVRANVKLFLGGNVHLISPLAMGGARVVKLTLEAGFQQPLLPAALQKLTRLVSPSLIDTRIEGGWEHVPRQLEELRLIRSGLETVPVTLARLTQLSELSIFGDNVEGGWGHLPRQLKELELIYCDLRLLPAELALLTQLTALDLAGGIEGGIEGGLEHLPRQLVELKLEECSLWRLPEELAGLEKLTYLCLHIGDSDGIEEGWEHLPSQLRHLDLIDGGLETVPAELQALARLSVLDLSHNRIEGGWQRLPPNLAQLDMSYCGLRQLPAELAGRDLQVKGIGT